MPKRLSIFGTHSTGAKPWPPIWNNYRCAVDVRAEGKGEKYVVSIPTYAYKEDLKQVVEDGMLIRNRNFIKLAELVRS